MTFYDLFRWRYWAESVKPQFERDFPAQSCSTYKDFEKGRCYGNRMNFMGLAANSRRVSFSFHWYSNISSLFVSSSHLIWTELPAPSISNFTLRETSQSTNHITSISSPHWITEATWWGYSRYFKDFSWICYRRRNQRNLTTFSANILKMLYSKNVQKWYRKIKFS